MRSSFGAAAFGLIYALVVRPWQLHWGATAEEAIVPMAGDDLVEQPDYITTRAITINAAPEAIWPWIVQMGQGRGGFYTYDRLEQFGGADIRSADRIHPELQSLTVGDIVRLSPVGGPRVALLDPTRLLVLHDTMDLRTGRSVSTDAPATFAMHWTWTYALRAVDTGDTRLLVRTRATFTRRLLCMPASILLLEPVHFIMERGMLLGIKVRAERHQHSSALAADVRNPADRSSR